jgi:hypothetical protein
VGAQNSVALNDLRVFVEDAPGRSRRRTCGSACLGSDTGSGRSQRWVARINRSVGVYLGWRT